MGKGKDQIFRLQPPMELITKLIQTFGLKGVEDKRCFTRKDLILIKTVDNILLLKPELEKYYLPCKARTYLNGLTPKNVITILRQCLRTQNYTVNSREKYIKGDKFIIYNIIPQEQKNYVSILSSEKEVKKITCEKKNVTVTFD